MTLKELETMTLNRRTNKKDLFILSQNFPVDDNTLRGLIDDRNFCENGFAINTPIPTPAITFDGTTDYFQHDFPTAPLKRNSADLQDNVQDLPFFDSVFENSQGLGESSHKRTRTASSGMLQKGQSAPALLESKQRKDSFQPYQPYGRSRTNSISSGLSHLNISMGMGGEGFHPSPGIGFEHHASAPAVYIKSPHDAVSPNILPIEDISRLNIPGSSMLNPTSAQAFSPSGLPSENDARSLQNGNGYLSPNMTDMRANGDYFVNMGLRPSSAGIHDNSIIDLHAFDLTPKSPDVISAINASNQSFEANRRPSFENGRRCISMDESKLNAVYEEMTGNGNFLPEPRRQSLKQDGPGRRRKSIHSYAPESNDASNAKPRRQLLRFENDQYTPSWVRHAGARKEGLCELCQPGKWLQLKNSAYWYHKQFTHGISSITGAEFKKPIEIRTVWVVSPEENYNIPNLPASLVTEGYCDHCQAWQPLHRTKKRYTHSFTSLEDAKNAILLVGQLLPHETSSKSLKVLAKKENGKIVIPNGFNISSNVLNEISECESGKVGGTWWKHAHKCHSEIAP